jgi:hypothetical protein
MAADRQSIERRGEGSVLGYPGGKIGAAKTGSPPLPSLDFTYLVSEITGFYWVYTLCFMALWVWVYTLFCMVWLNGIYDFYILG